MDKTLKILLDTIDKSNKSEFNIRVYFGRYISYFKDTQITVSYNSIKDIYDLNIAWVEDDESLFSIIEMNLSDSYSSDSTDFEISDNLLIFYDDAKKIEIELK